MNWEKQLLLIGADLVPTDSNSSLFEKGDVSALVGGEILSLMEKAEYRIFNLEVPLCDHADPIRKRGPNLRAGTGNMEGIRKLADVVSIANNHILDQGEQGLLSTCRLLNRHHIEYVGAGSCLENMKKTLILETSAGKVGIYSCCEHEFSVAGKDKAGANPYDPLESFDDVRDLSGACDYTVVLYHGGIEHYRYPSPELQRRCRKFAACGADLVVCQHSHCIGAMEKWNEGTIVYGQGNFLFDHKEDECWQTGLLICVDPEFHLTFLPLRKTGNTVRLAEEGDAANIRKGFLERSREISEEAFVCEKFRTFAMDREAYYLRLANGVTRKNLPFHILNRITGRRWEKWRMHRRYHDSALVALQNVLECEAHREIMIAGIREERRKK